MTAGDGKLFLLALLAATVALAGCTGYVGQQPQGETGGGQPSGQQAGAAAEQVSGVTADITVNMQNTQFQSNPTVQAGTVVRFVNQDSYSHTVTIQAEGIDVSVAGGESVTLRFNEAGSYNVVCTIHPGMETLVTVSG